MFDVAWQTLRSRWLLFLGSFVALSFGITLIASTGLVLYSTARPQPPVELGRYDAAAVVVRADQDQSIPVGSGAAAHTLVQRTTEPRRLPAATVDALRGVAGVAQVVPDRTFAVRLITRSGALDPGDQKLSGHGWGSAALTPFGITDGAPPTRPDDVVLSAGLAERTGVDVGAKVRVVTASGPEEVTVSGIAAPPGATGVPGEYALFFTDDTAAKLSGAPDQVDTIGLLAAPGTPPDALAAAVRGALPDASTLVLVGADKGGHVEAESFVDSTNEIAALLGLMAVIAAFVSVFVVASTFAFSVGQRRREIALLRTIGATSRQIRDMIMGEALVIGVLASACGCAVGVVGANLLADVLVAINVAPAGFRAPGVPLVLGIAFVMGLVVALFGALAASRRASRVRPAEALREASVEGRVMTTGRWVVGLLFLAIAVAIFVALPGFASDGMVVFSTLLTEILVVALVALAPVFIPAVTWLAAGPVALVTTAIGLLARENTRNSLRRTASTAAPVLVTMAIAGSILSIVSTSGATTADDNRTHLLADVVVSVNGAGGIPESTTARLEATPGVRAVVPVRQTNGWLVGDNSASPATIGAMDPSALAAAFKFDVLAGDMAGVTGTGVAISRDVSALTGWQVGQDAVVYLGDGTRTDVRVAAVLAGSGQLPGVVARPELVAGHVHDPLVTTAYVAVDQGADVDAVIGALRPAAESVGADVATAGGWLDEQTRSGNQTGEVAALVLIGLALVYSVIAIANTLIMASGERAGDVELLRKLGATRGQIIATLAVETTVVVAVGVVLGLLTAGISLVGVGQGLVAETGQVNLDVPWARLGVIALVCAVVALLATIVPALLSLRSRTSAAASRTSDLMRQ